MIKRNYLLYAWSACCSTCCLPRTSNQDHTRRSPEAEAAVEGVAAAAAELEGPLRPQHLQLIGKLGRRLGEAAAQGEDAEAALLVDACAATLEGGDCGSGPSGSRATANQERFSQVRCMFRCDGADGQTLG
jgi:hypothetical protein